MRFTLRRTFISTGGPRIIILTRQDARRLGVHAGDRVKLSTPTSTTVAVVDTTPTGREGVILVHDEVWRDLHGAREAEVSLVPHPQSLSLIRRKLDGEELTDTELYEIIRDITQHRLKEDEIAFFVSGVYLHGLTLQETISLTRAMVQTGETIIFPYETVDKHCTGGVPNNRTTMLIVPILASLGLKIPKTSSRSITSPAGTADTMEVLANVSLTADQIRHITDTAGGVMAWGGALNLAPADDLIIRVERSLQLDAEGQLIASVLAKKASVNAKRVLIDIPVGKHTKFTSKKQALSTAKRFKHVGKALGMHVHVIITDGNEPIGRGIGPLLEARDVLWVLEQDPRRPRDLEEKAVWMASILLEMSGVRHAERKAWQALRKGLALAKMREIIRLQGRKHDQSGQLRLAPFKHVIRADKAGRHAGYHTRHLSILAQILGAPLDKRAGVYLERVKNDPVKPGDPVLTLYAENTAKLEAGIKYAMEHEIFTIRDA